MKAVRMLDAPSSPCLLLSSRPRLTIFSHPRFCLIPRFAQQGYCQVVEKLNEEQQKQRQRQRNRLILQCPGPAASAPAPAQAVRADNGKKKREREAVAVQGKRPMMTPGGAARQVRGRSAGGEHDEADDDT